ncbi:MAG: ABC transporter permease [Bryobacteraceae bacterium]
MIQDLRFAVRLLAKNPGFAAAAVICLALGIGANSVVFSYIDGAITRPLPVRDAMGMVRLHGVANNEPRASLSYAEYLDFRNECRSFSGLFAVQRRGPILSGPGFDDATMTEVVSENYFTGFGVGAEAGAVFTPAAGGSSAEPVVVISYNLWRRRFGADPAVVGKTVRLGGRAFTVIGVARRGFRGSELWLDTDLWIPMASWEALSPGEWKVRRLRGIGVRGRLRPGVPVKQARAEVETVAARLAERYPESNRGRSATVLTEWQARTQAGKYLALALLGIVGMVLLIACANVANLLLARAYARRHEIAIRVAVGGSRAQLVRQFLAESAVLGALGAVVGLLLAMWAIRGLPALMLPPNGYLHNEFYLDTRVMAATIALSALTVLLFGLAPAIATARADVNAALKRGAGATRRRVRTRDALVALQVALSLVLLTGAGMFVRAYLNAANADLGFQRRGVLTMEISPPPRPSGVMAFYDELLARVRGLPGVRGAAVALRTPLAGHGGGMSSLVVIPGYEQPAAEGKLDIRYTAVGTDYFRVLGTRLLHGRVFGDHDHSQAPPVAIINETMARRFWPGQDPVGRHFLLGEKDHEIAGVVEDVRVNAIEESPQPYMYVPVKQSSHGSLTLMVETPGDPLALVNPVRAAMAGVDDRARATEISTISLLLKARLHFNRSGATVVTALGLVGLLLAAVGLYGVMSYNVTERRVEIGVRMALGAQYREALGMVLRRGLLLAGIGCAAGFAGALAGARTLAGMLYKVDPLDWQVYGAAVAVLLGVAALASYIPARRAARTDPNTVLRYE